MSASGWPGLARRVAASGFVRQAAWVTGANFASRLVALIANAYAARCLGPAFLGISGAVQSLADQAARIFNAGLEPVAARRIAEDRSLTRAVVASVLRVRFTIAVILAIVWTAVVLAYVRSEHRLVWSLGVPLILGTAGQLSFAFLGRGELVTQVVIGAVNSLLIATLFLGLFHPGMPLGSDLVVLAAAAIGTTLVSWVILRIRLGHEPMAPAGVLPSRPLVREAAWLWLQSWLVYFYTLYQVPFALAVLGSQAAGELRVALTLAGGMELFFSSINNMLLPRFVEWRRQGSASFHRRLHRTALGFVAAGLPVSVAAWVLAGPVIGLLFGNEFREAVIPFRLFAVGRFVVFVGLVYWWALASQRRDGILVVAALAGAVVSIGLNLVVARRYGTVGMGAVVIVAEIVVYGVCFVAFLRGLDEGPPGQATTP